MIERSLVCFLAALIAGCTSLAVPTAEGPMATPPASLDPTARPTASASAMESATPTATASPTPSAPPVGGLETLELQATGCPGGVVLDWSPTTQPEFHHYTALRSLEPDVRPDYPPIAPAVDWGDTYGTDRFVTSAVDATLIPSEATFSYRVMAYDVRDEPVAASVVRRTRPSEVGDLGSLEVGAGIEGATRLGWRVFDGPPECFSGYRVLIGPVGGSPSTTLTVISSQTTTELDTRALHAGETYAMRVEAVRTTTLGAFVVADSTTATYAVP